MSNSNKKGKSVARSHSNVGSLKEAASGSSSEAGTNMEDNQGQISFENTPFGQLLGEMNILDTFKSQCKGIPAYYFSGNFFILPATV